MSEPSFYQVTPEHRELAVQYAKMKKMTPSTIAKHRSGRSDGETLLQFIAKNFNPVPGDEAFSEVTDPTTPSQGILDLSDELAVKDARIQELLGIIQVHIENSQSANEIIGTQHSRISKLKNGLRQIGNIAHRQWFGRGAEIETVVAEVLNADNHY